MFFFLVLVKIKLCPVFVKFLEYEWNRLMELLGDRKNRVFCVMMGGQEEDLSEDNVFNAIVKGGNDCFHRFTVVLQSQVSENYLPILQFD